MSTLHLGVRVVAYTDDENPQSTTTYQVARILERKYGVMATFYNRYSEQIAHIIGRRYMTALSELVGGSTFWSKKKNWPLDQVDSLFRDYLDRDEWQREHGFTIAAARQGRSARKKAGRYSGPRPAFVDTRHYQQSFRAWLIR